MSQIKLNEVVDTPSCFELFYIMIHNRALPPHARKWVDALYDAREAGSGIIIEAFRGSTKTTTMMTYVAFQIGLYPEKSNLIVQVGDDIAKNNTLTIADIISHNPAWQAFFPHVIPDSKMGWGAGGYEVQRNDIEYHDWRRINAGRKDPTLVGVGRTSRAIIGKHPDGLLVIDDIDDENTTSSDRERSKTRKILTGTIFPTITPETGVIAIGTPWTMTDTLSYLKATNEFIECKTPVYDEDGSSAWPDVFTVDEIEKHRRRAGELEFARMFLLDLEAAKGINLKDEWLHYYPFDKIDMSWPVVMGVDYASTADRLKDKGSDYFAMAIGRLMPGGGVVLTDGYRGHLSQGEAVAKLEEYALHNPTTIMIVVEKEGVGNQFLELLRTQTALTIHGATTADKISPDTPSARNKGDRFQKQMAPYFEFSRVWVSNEENSFLKVFRDEWLSWPIGTYDDTLDATYYMIYAAVMMGGLAQQKRVQMGVGADNAWFEPPPKQPNPWNIGVR